jgi:hypothetical protein
MRLFIGQSGCYKVTALQEEAGWRVRIWSDGKGGQAHDYCVENGQFSTVGETGDSSVARAEREAVLNMIAKWEADNGQEAFQAAA